MKVWFHFGVPVGQGLVIVGWIDLLIGMAKCLHSSMRAFYGAEDHRKELTEFSWHIDYLELTQATIEGSKIILALMLWIGMILISKIVLLKLWMCLTAAIDVLQVILIGAINYHFWQTETVALSPLHFLYLAAIRLLMRCYLIIVAVNYNRVYDKFRAKGELAASTSISPAIQQRQRDAQNELARDLMPVGLGFNTRLFQFYLGDADRLVRFLLISDLVWCVCKILSREISQALFQREEMFYPTSSSLTPILVEERFICITRIIFDVYFLRSLHKKTLASSSWWILPKFMETIISVGILVFVIATENTFPTFVIVLFCLFFSSDLFFRMLLLGTCLKSYVNHREKIASSVRKRTHSQQTG